MTRADFRYIVVGGGSAGCLLARRLAERQPEPVALLEAGESTNSVRTVVPSFYPKLFGSSLDWRFATEPQAALGGRRISWPRGKMLGGSGAMNALIYLQAAQADFQRWGWSWAIDAAHDATTAPTLSHEPMASVHPWTRAFLQACTESGLAESSDLDQSTAGYCGVVSLAHRAGRRLHTGQNLQEVDNLTILTSREVLQIVLRDGRATSVKFRDSQNRLTSLAASAEIIVCCGAVGSPLLLLKSGIGPADHLQDTGIPCQHEIAGVGRNLQDHLVYPVIFETHVAAGLPRRHSRDARRLYREQGSGSLASNIAEATALIAQGISRQSDFQIHFTPTHYLKYPQTPAGENHLTLAVTDLHPRSRGTIRASRDPHGELTAAIDAQYLSADADIPRMLSAIDWARRLAEQSGLRGLICREVLPGAKRRDEKSLIKSLRAYAQSIYHPVGTCRMVSDVEPRLAECVVDQEFRVTGIAGLRVADASILPELPSANTSAVTLLLASRAVDCMVG